MSDSPDPSRLSPRERRCLELVAQHLDSEAIGAELGIAASTANRYIHDACRKLGARNRKEGARILLELDGEGPPPSKNGGGIQGVGELPADPPVPVMQPVTAAPMPNGWQRLLHFERAFEPSRLGPVQRLMAIVGILFGLSLGLGLAVIAAAGILAIYGSLRF